MELRVIETWTIFVLMADVIKWIKYFLKFLNRIIIYIEWL